MIITNVTARWERAFCSFVYAYVLRFYEYSRSTRKNKIKDKQSLIHISMEWLNNALFGKEITKGLELGLFCNAISWSRNVECLSVRSLESWNGSTCTSYTWLPCPIGQVCSQVWCSPYLAMNFGFFELRTFPRSSSKVEVGKFYPFILKVGSKYT